MSVKTELLETLAVSADDFISGAGLAKKLGVSRNAVWKAVKALEEEGFLIESERGKGYRISERNNHLSATVIAGRLRTKALGRDLTVLDTAGSTNNVAKELASSGAAHGMTVIADSQTGGKGRMGRKFVSPAGKGLYMSVVIRPEISIETAQLITSCAACAVAETIEELCGCRTGIKWVNDIYIGGKKVCGILTEASMSVENAALEYAVIGIGINVFSSEKEMGEDLSRIVSSVESETGKKINRDLLAAELLNRLETRLENITGRDFIEDYRKRELLTGNIVTLNTAGKQTECRAIGIDDNANLIVELADRTVRAINSGEANLCRIKK